MGCCVALRCASAYDVPVDPPPWSPFLRRSAWRSSGPRLCHLYDSTIPTRPLLHSTSTSTSSASRLPCVAAPTPARRRPPSIPPGARPRSRSLTARGLLPRCRAHIRGRDPSTISLLPCPALSPCPVSMARAISCTRLRCAQLALLARPAASAPIENPSTKPSRRHRQFDRLSWNPSEGTRRGAARLASVSLPVRVCDGLRLPFETYPTLVRVL